MAKWEGYQETSWENRCNFSDALIDDFEENRNIAKNNGEETASKKKVKKGLTNNGSHSRKSEKPANVFTVRKALDKRFRYFYFSY